MGRVWEFLRWIRRLACAGLVYAYLMLMLGSRADAMQLRDFVGFLLGDRVGESLPSSLGSSCSRIDPNTKLFRVRPHDPAVPVVSALGVRLERDAR